MTTLWLAFGIYIAGVVIILLLRPNIMFRAGSGSWREFGLSNTGNYTVFPFWMFTLVWAIISYALATLGTVFIASSALKSLPEANRSILTPASEMPPVFAPTPTPAPPTITPSASGLPGYYVLDTRSATAPQYVYFGSNPPTLANLSGTNAR
jgi:hypothetical protein